MRKVPLSPDVQQALRAKGDFIFGAVTARLFEARSRERETALA